MIGFDLAQTFYVDKDAVKKSDTVYLTSVDLYFKSKPVSGKTKTGITSPGADVYICPLDDRGTPALAQTYTKSFARVEYSGINTSSTGATATTFTFRVPLLVRTNRSYALLIKFDGSDPDFELWINKSSSLNTVGSTRTQVSSGKVDGAFYRITNGSSLTPETDADLVFRLKIARFTSTSTTFKVVNRPAETLKLDTVSGTFKGGELVYQEAANATGNIATSSSNVAIVGTGTSFTTYLAVGDYIVLTDGTAGNTNIRQVATRANATYITVDATPTFTAASAKFFKAAIGRVASYNPLTDVIVLQDSTATATLYFQSNTDIVGVDSGASANVNSLLSYNVNSVIPNFNINTPTGTSTSTEITFVEYDSTGPTYTVSGTNTRSAILGQRKFLNEFAAGLAPRSTEVTDAIPFNSYSANITFTTNNEYASPSVLEEDLDVFVERFHINNSDTNEYKGTGNAQSRYISKTINLSKDQLAEDLKVYVTAYKPENTDIKVYARFRNSADVETLDVKDWTELTRETDDQTSSPANLSDLIEISYTVPQYSTDVTTASGFFTTNSSLAYAVGTSGAVNTDITTGDLVRVYSPTIPTIFFVDSVTNANTTTFTLGNGTTTLAANASIVGSGFKADKVTRKNSAFVDIQSKNVLTYFNTSMAKFQGYDSFAIKIVMLSEDGIRVPFVDDVRAIAVSA